MYDLIDVHEEHRAIHIESKENYPTKHWAQEFCTIKVDIGRQIGKNKFIYLRADKNSLIIDYNGTQSHLTKRVLKEKYNKNVDCFSGLQIHNPTKSRAEYLEGKSYTQIFINEPSFMGIDKWDWIYNDLIMRSDVDQTFFFIGM
ncbi:MAG: hypothetical protein KAS32_00655 [Candidatus Peribacteraceae bacterium]|nr:hypothetical protein [Candidatus Peribacteraceae bacterium]